MADALLGAMASKTPALDEPEIRETVTACLYKRLFGETLAGELVAMSTAQNHNPLFLIGQRLGGEEMIKALNGQGSASSFRDLLES